MNFKLAIYQNPRPKTPPGTRPLDSPIQSASRLSFQPGVGVCTISWLEAKLRLSELGRYIHTDFFEYKIKAVNDRHIDHPRSRAVRKGFSAFYAAIVLDSCIQALLLLSLLGARPFFRSACVH